MVHDEWPQLVIAVLSWPGVSWLIRFTNRRILKNPKADAETRKINAEASRVEWGTLRDEIDRLTKTVQMQGQWIFELETQAVNRGQREEELGRENKRLRTEIGRLRSRIEELEEILKLKSTPGDMKAQLDRLHERTRDKGESEK